jgi:hypothetical protein
VARVIRHFDLDCFLFKVYLDKIPFFKRFLLGYQKYFYRIEVISKEPLRGNRYKFADVELNGKSYVQNKFNIELKDIRKNKEPDLSFQVLNHLIYGELYNQVKSQYRR